MAGTDGFLLNNLLLFGRLLRSLGLDVDTARMLDLVQSLNFIEIQHRADFYEALRCSLIHRREDIALFDQAFDLFWREPEPGRSGLGVKVQGEVRRSRRPSVSAPPLRPNDAKAIPPQIKASTNRNRPPEVQATLTYSDREVLRRKDFSELTPDEMEAIKHLLDQLVWQLGSRRTRRFHPGEGVSLDLRHSFRQNIHYGGELIEWPRRQPKLKPRSLVVVADISGSMERYTRLLLHFAHGISHGLAQGVETFVFSTRLTRISRLLREKNVDQALRQVSQNVPDWSGGTRIGEALRDFNFRWGRRVLSHGALVLLISDGWDCGDVQLLHDEISRLQRSCYRLIWLNPLLGAEDYEPLAQGMQTALPYIDDFLPVHNLASLEDLALHLQQIDNTRPIRRQFVKKVS
ncbi:MAG: VWA domain-containing protein [Anaerolineaceae bacterium]|nr:VWA domain-containing protein [Anaerolineaceae bacterium]